MNHCFLFCFFFTLCWITFVNKLLCPELTKTNQIWAEDICISWGTGLDLEVISYEPVLSRRRCNVSMSSTFNCSLCEPSLFSKSERGSSALQIHKPNTLGWDLTRMELRGAQSMPIHTWKGSLGKVQLQHWHKHRSKACIRVRLAKITLSVWSPWAPNAGPCWQIKLQCLDSLAH